jgi:hypothetical protein
MAYSMDDVAHRWAHNQMGKNGEVRGSSVHADEVSYYSYSTVIAQYVDRNKKVVLLDDGNYSMTTNRHQWAVRSSLPDDVIIIKTPTAYAITWGHKWTKDRRLWLVNELISHVYCYVKGYIESRKSLQSPFKYTYYQSILTLAAAYNNDCSLKQWLESSYGKLGKASKKSDQFHKREMVKAMLACKDAEIITWKDDKSVIDAACGEGTYDAYQNRRSGVRKGQETLRKTKKFMYDYMGFDEKGFQNHYGYENEIHSPWTAKEIRKMTASQRIDIRAHVKYNREHGIYGDDIFGEERRKREAHERALKFLGIIETAKRWGYRRDCDDDNEEIAHVKDGDKNLFYPALYNRTVNPDGSTGRWVSYPYELSNLARIDCGFTSQLYEDFKASHDKKQFRKRLWQKLMLIDRRLKGYWLQECVKENPDFEVFGDDNHILNELIVRRERYEEQERIRRERLNAEYAERERERKEEERRSQMRKIEMMEQYQNGGLDAVRELYWSGECQLPYDIRYNEDINYGGNVLLRLAKQQGIVETSKGIRMTFEECHRYWNIIKEWHDKGTFTKNITMAGYSVQSFENDILTAGCHKIAWCEIERCYKAMCEREAA